MSNVISVSLKFILSIACTSHTHPRYRSINIDIVVVVCIGYIAKVVHLAWTKRMRNLVLITRWRERQSLLHGGLLSHIGLIRLQSAIHNWGHILSRPTIEDGSESWILVVTWNYRDAILIHDNVLATSRTLAFVTLWWQNSVCLANGLFNGICEGASWKLENFRFLNSRLFDLGTLHVQNRFFLVKTVLLAVEDQLLLIYIYFLSIYFFCCHFLDDNRALPHTLIIKIGFDYDGSCSVYFRAAVAATIFNHYIIN